MSFAEYSGGRFFDYVVVGCGGIGSAALYWLSKRAKHGVLGLEQFELGHHKGASQDHSRMIRKAYDEACYINLINDAYKAWEEIEAESGIRVLHKTGGLVISKVEESKYLEKNVEAMAKHKIPFERLTGKQLRAKFPVFQTDDTHVVVYQEDKAIIDAALANAVHVQLARGNGAAILENCEVLGFDKDRNGRIQVKTTKGKFYCRKVIVTSGAWMNRVLESIGVHIPIYVTQEQVTYFATPHMKELTKEKHPAWFFPTSTYDFYGVPIHGNTGYKIGIDVGGPFVTTETRTFQPDPVREKACLDFLKQIIPKAAGPILYTKTCLYTMPPDRNFVIDTCHRQGWNDVIVCNGAGHAYKFAGVLGKILSEMAIDGGTQNDIAPFSMDRPALRDPNYPLMFLKGSENKSSSSKSRRDILKSTL